MKENTDKWAAGKILPDACMESKNIKRELSTDWYQICQTLIPSQPLMCAYYT